ncbi:MAG: thermonuclease family protein [Desulfovibrio sp.]|nr:thermonuclease family protein [Desulfovibrio sp.]
MVRAVLKIFLILVILCYAQISYAWQGYVARVEDANTILVGNTPQAQDNLTVVRLYGIDAPVLQQPYAKEAHAFLQKLLPQGTEVNVENTGEASDGTLTALVQVKATSVNYQLIMEGLAWVNRSTCKALFCRRWYIQEHRAVEQGRGLWGLKLSTPPWQWGR